MTARPGQRLAAVLSAASLLAMTLVPSRPVQGAGDYTEDAVKAAFLYRFASYVAWPPEAVSPSVFTIAVMGDEAIAADLEQLLPSHPIMGRAAVVRRISSLSQIGDAQILYLGGASDSRLHSLIAALGTRPVLIVTDSQKGIAAGATLNFLRERRRMRFEVSLLAAERAHLKISAELLAVAARVEGASTARPQAWQPRRRVPLV